MNNKGEVVKTTTTNDLGWFLFTEIPPGEDYVVAMDESDTKFIGKKSFAEFKDNKGNVIKTKNLGSKFQAGTTSVSFKNSKQKPENSIAIIDKPVKDKPVKNKPVKDKPVKDKPENSINEQLATTDKLNFQMFFKYNVTQIDVNAEPFKEYVNNLAELYQKNGHINFYITAYASQVPTRAYKTNKDLAIARAEKAKEQIITALKEKGLDESKIKFVKVNGFVGGPTYSIDYLINKTTYEKFQYVKMNAN